MHQKLYSVRYDNCGACRTQALSVKSVPQRQGKRCTLARQKKLVLDTVDVTVGCVLSLLRRTKSSNSSLESRTLCVFSVSGSMVSKPSTKALHSFVRRKWIELDCTDVEFLVD